MSCRMRHRRCQTYVSSPLTLIVSSTPALLEHRNVQKYQLALHRLLSPAHRHLEGWEGGLGDRFVVLSAEGGVRPRSSDTGWTVTVSGAEVGERTSHTKVWPAGVDDKCRVRSEAFQSWAGDVFGSDGEGRRSKSSVKPNQGSVQRHLREPSPPLHHALRQSEAQCIC
jgi:hypothetical protein